ncbi:MAG: hypothetical protein DRG83_19020 [Deltaproteobacteria bacterium]|nr:MAG: hypothetical protein DRG83_19020 [Deltaproteobacteria bacterium]
MQMQVEIVDNISRKLVSVLLPAIEQSQEVRIAVAFVSHRGLSMIEPSVKRSLQRGAYIEFLVGLDLSTTEPKALWTLYELSQHEDNIELYCYTELGPSVVYHPKLYITNAKEEVTAVLGSSNLTSGGLKSNLEANVVIRANINEEIISDVYATYNKLKFDPRRVEPDLEFLQLYEQLRERHRRREQSARRDKSSRKLMSEFREKAKTLRRPTPTSRDLVGWLRLVYEHLPEGEFTNQQIYAYEDEFQRYYPNNLNVRAKIRQQLQYLRDMGLVEHVSQARWRKV